MRPEEREATLPARIARGLLWSYAGTSVRVIIQVATGVVLARLLGPHAVGVYTSALLYFGLALLASELGLGAALVQQSVVSDAEVYFVLRTVLVAAIVLAALAVPVGYAVSVWFNEPQIFPAMAAMGVPIVAQAAGMPSAAMLRRELHFRQVQRAQILSYVAGFSIVGIGLAALGAGHWAPVVGMSVQTMVCTAFLLAARPIRKRPGAELASNRLSRFAATALSTNIANWLTETVDTVLVGRFFGPTALGLYTVSFNLVRTPTAYVVASIQSLLFAATSRMQEVPSRARLAYATAINGLGILITPALFGLAAVSDTAVEALYGKQWLAAAPLLATLSVAMAAHAWTVVAGPFLWGVGKPGLELRVQVVVAVLLIAAVAAASQVALSLVAWSVCAVYIIRAIWVTRIVAARLELSRSEVLGIAARSSALGLASFAVLYGIDAILHLSRMSPLVRLLIEALCGAVGLGLTFRLSSRFLFTPTARAGTAKLATNLPAGLLRAFRWLTRGAIV